MNGKLYFYIVLMWQLTWCGQKCIATWQHAYACARARVCTCVCACVCATRVCRYVRVCAARVCRYVRTCAHVLLVISSTLFRIFANALITFSLDDVAKSGACDCVNQIAIA